MISGGATEICIIASWGAAGVSSSSVFQKSAKGSSGSATCASPDAASVPAAAATGAPPATCAEDAVHNKSQVLDYQRGDTAPHKSSESHVLAEYATEYHGCPPPPPPHTIPTSTLEQSSNNFRMFLNLRGKGILKTRIRCSLRTLYTSENNRNVSLDVQVCSRSILYNDLRRT